VMPRRVFASSGLLAAIAAPALAGGSLVVFDANQKVLGEVVHVAPATAVGSSHDLMLYRYGANESLLLPVNRDGIMTGGSYFETTDCTGQTWTASEVRNWPDRSYAAGYRSLDGQLLYRIEPGAGAVVVTMRSHLDEQGVCIAHVTSGYPWLPADPIGPPPTYVAPLSYVLNPTIFWDQFQTGDLTRWSNY